METATELARGQHAIDNLNRINEALRKRGRSGKPLVTLVQETLDDLAEATARAERAEAELREAKAALVNTWAGDPHAHGSGVKLACEQYAEAERRIAAETGDAFDNEDYVFEDAVRTLAAWYRESEDLRRDAFAGLSFDEMLARPGTLGDFLRDTVQPALAQGQTTEAEADGWRLKYEGEHALLRSCFADHAREVAHLRRSWARAVGLDFDERAMPSVADLEAATAKAFAAPLQGAGTENRSEPPPGYRIVLDRDREWRAHVVADVPRGALGGGYYDDREAVIAACWAHRDAVLASAAPSAPQGGPAGLRAELEQAKRERDEARRGWATALANDAGDGLCAEPGDPGREPINRAEQLFGTEEALRLFDGAASPPHGEPAGPPSACAEPGCERTPLLHSDRCRDHHFPPAPAPTYVPKVGDRVEVVTCSDTPERQGERGTVRVRLDTEGLVPVRLDDGAYIWAEQVRPTGDEPGETGPHRDRGCVTCGAEWSEEEHGAACPSCPSTRQTTGHDGLHRDVRPAGQVEPAEGGLLVCPACGSTDIDNVGDGETALCMSCGQGWVPGAAAKPTTPGAATLHGYPEPGEDGRAP